MVDKPFCNGIYRSIERRAQKRCRLITLFYLEIYTTSRRGQLKASLQFPPQHSIHALSGTQIVLSLAG